MSMRAPPSCVRDSGIRSVVRKPAYLPLGSMSRGCRKLLPSLCAPYSTNMFVLYGAHSDGNSFLHPRDMDPSGKYAGFLTTDLMPLSRTHEGGALMLIDAAHYSEQNTPAAAGVPTTGGQQQATVQQLNYGTGISQYGRISSPYPLWDGTNRILVGFSPCEVTSQGVGVVSCATLSATDLARLSSNRLTTD